MCTTTLHKKTSYNKVIFFLRFVFDIKSKTTGGSLSCSNSINLSALCQMRRFVLAIIKVSFCTNLHSAIIHTIHDSEQ